MYDRFQLDCSVDVPDLSSDLFIDNAGWPFVFGARAYPKSDRAPVGLHEQKDMQNNRSKRPPRPYNNFECRKFTFFANMPISLFTTFRHAIKVEASQELCCAASVPVTCLQLLLFSFIIIYFRVSGGTISKNMSFRAYIKNFHMEK